MKYKSFSGEEYESITDYIKKSIKNGVSWINFKDLKDFNELITLGFLRRGMVIRTSNKGVIDECYLIRNKRLEGILEGPYPAKEKGPFHANKILKGNKISGGWSIFLEGKFGVNFRKNPNQNH